MSSCVSLLNKTSALQLFLKSNLFALDVFVSRLFVSHIFLRVHPILMYIIETKTNEIDKALSSFIVFNSDSNPKHHDQIGTISETIAKIACTQGITVSR